MEDKNLNLIINGYNLKINKNEEIKHNKSYNGMKIATNKINYSPEICKNMEIEDSFEQNNIKNNPDLNKESNLKTLIKANKTLQNELKNEKNKKQQDIKKINFLKHAINNLISEQDRNIINNQLNSNFYSNILNKKIFRNNNLTYADIIINAENILEENYKLKSELSIFTKVKNENFELKNKLMEKEQALNNLISNNIDLGKKLEISENKISKLYEKLKEFQKFEEIKLLNSSLNKNLKTKCDEIIELNKILREKEKQIIDLKNMKYDDKLFVVEQELNECKLEETKYINEIIKIKSDLSNTEKKLEMNSDLLEQSQKALKENRKNLETNKNKYNNIKSEYRSLKNTNNVINNENNELKKQISKMIKELKEYKEYYIKYKEELNNAKNELIKIKGEKEKEEIYYLDQIKILQKEKNYLEKNLNEIKNKYLFNKNLENLLNTNNKNSNEKNEDVNNSKKYDEKFFQKKYEIAINEINSFNNDNKKLFDLSKKFKNEINILTEEKNFYLSIINKIIDKKYIDSKYDKFVNAIKKSIENNSDILNMNIIKYDLGQNLLKYEKIMKNMNKKIESKETGKSYEINKNFYNVDDFSEIARIQNQIITINDKLNTLYEIKTNIKKDIEMY